MKANNRFKDLGDKLKSYERFETGRKFLPRVPIIIRIDGRAFHTFTRGLDRPFSKPFGQCMVKTTEHLVQESNALIGYTQSDEISLLLYSDKLDSQVYFDGKIFKVTSQLAAQATLRFYQELGGQFPDNGDQSHWRLRERNPTFDCRAFSVPKEDVVDYFLWREWDASKNSISMAASTVASPKKLDRMNSAQRQDLLHDKGINWNDYPSHFKRGTYIQRAKVTGSFTSEELENLPEKHHAHQNPDHTFERTTYKRLRMNRLSSVINPHAVFFNGEPPQYEAD